MPPRVPRTKVQLTREAVRRTTALGPRELGWLDAVHPIYRANKDRWLINERRLAGGDDVLDELQPFEWEQLRGVGTNFQYRLDQAIYPNFADDFLTVTTGHLLRFAPKPDAGLDFGTLGKVRRTRSAADPTNAELIYYSADSPGPTGQPWDPFWLGVTKRAGATGHRWLYCDTPNSAPQSVADERQGKRPYLVEFSPLDAPNWGFSQDGQLDFIIFRLQPGNNVSLDYAGGARQLRRKDQNYLLLVREGFADLGEAFMGGGWFLFNPDKVLLDSNTWDDTDGDIPCWPHFWEKTVGTRSRPAMSRPSITELGSAGVAYMNIESAANFDCWDAAKSIEWISGVDDTGYALARAKLSAGSRWIPLPPNEDTDQIPQVDHGSGGAVAQDTFTNRLEAITKTAMKLGITEVAGLVGQGTANTHTGASKAASFGERQVPRIVHVATNLGTSQNLAIYFLERRWGNANPAGSTNWPDRIDLIELVDKLQSFFEVERIAGIRSATLDAKAMTMVAMNKGLILSDDDRVTIEREYLESAQLRDKLEAQSAAMVDATLQNTPVGKRSGGPGTGSTPPQNPRTAAKQANRLAKQKASKGGPKQNPGGRST